MRKAFIAFMAVAMGLVFASASYALTNSGKPADHTFAGHSLTSPEAGPGLRVLYAPSEPDDPGFRFALAGRLGGGAVVDYFDAISFVPDVALLDTYDCVVLWVDYLLPDAVTYGNNLATYVSHGGTVVLGAFTVYTSGFAMAGDIVDDLTLCPVSGGFNWFATSFWSGDGASDCLHDGVIGYDAYFRDILTLDGTGAAAPGHYLDGEISVAHNAARSVVYVNGMAGFFLSNPDIDLVTANACVCSGPIANEPSTWGNVKGLYR
jgi:hypothetical protein